jgi:large subunit ribosomal protein L15
MKLHELSPAKGSKKRRKRVGRGPGSGLGKTAGRGHKGQRSRTGFSQRAAFEGGQMPLVRRVPKRGFTNPTRVEYEVVNLSQLSALEAGTEVTPELLYETGLVDNGRRIKILGDGELSASIKVTAHKFSQSARSKIEAAGGSVEVLES